MRFICHYCVEIQSNGCFLIIYVIPICFFSPLSNTHLFKLTDFLTKELLFAQECVFGICIRACFWWKTRHHFFIVCDALVSQAIRAWCKSKESPLFSFAHSISWQMQQELGRHIFCHIFTFKHACCYALFIDVGTRWYLQCSVGEAFLPTGVGQF